MMIAYACLTKTTVYFAYLSFLKITQSKLSLRQRQNNGWLRRWNLKRHNSPSPVGRKISPLRSNRQVPRSLPPFPLGKPVYVHSSSSPQLLTPKIKFDYIDGGVKQETKKLMRVSSDRHLDMRDQKSNLVSRSMENIKMDMEKELAKIKPTHRRPPIQRERSQSEEIKEIAQKDLVHLQKVHSTVLRSNQTEVDGVFRKSRTLPPKLRTELSNPVDNRPNTSRFFRSSSRSSMRMKSTFKLDRYLHRLSLYSKCSVPGFKLWWINLLYSCDVRL